MEDNSHTKNSFGNRRMLDFAWSWCVHMANTQQVPSRHFSLLNVTFAGACGYDFVCDGQRLVRAYLRRRRGAI